MELNRCNRCGAFYATSNDVCPKCVSIDNLELSTFKNYIEENGLTSLDSMSIGTGISAKNINRFITLEGLNLPDNQNTNIVGNNGITLN